MLSDYTLWHQRMGHTYQNVIKYLNKNTEGGPNQITVTPTRACEKCEKGKSRRLPFPPSISRAKQPLDLVHSDLDKIPVLSIGRYKYTTTYLDDYSSFGVMFYLKNKSGEFAAFNAYKAWDELMLNMLKQNKVRSIPTWNQTFWLGIVSDHCVVKTYANDIILTAHW